MWDQGLAAAVKAPCKTLPLEQGEVAQYLEPDWSEMGELGTGGVGD